MDVNKGNQRGEVDVMSSFALRLREFVLVPGQVSLNEKKNEEIHELYFETMSSLALRLVQVSLSESLFSSVGSSVPFVRERSGVRTPDLSLVRTPDLSLTYGTLLPTELKRLSDKDTWTDVERGWTWFQSKVHASSMGRMGGTLLDGKYVVFGFLVIN
jgi:hypothetical protein